MNSRPAPTPTTTPPSSGPPTGYTLTSVAASAGLPQDALPMDVDPGTGHILLSSYSAGVLELSWPLGQTAPTINRAWKTDVVGNPGEARYGASSSIYVNVHGQGLGKVTDQGVSVVHTSDGLVNADLLDILVRSNGDVWVVGVPNPFGGGFGLQILVNDHPSALVPTAGFDVTTLRSTLDMPDRQSVFGATAAGVVELNAAGLIAKLSQPGRVTRLRRQAGSGAAALGGVGAGVERWDGKQFSVVTDPFRLPPTSGSSWDPQDLGIAPNGNWVILCADGVLSVIDPTGAFLGQFDTSSGVPPSAQRLLVLADGRRILVGGQQGSALLSW
jgi:hypothetical protein